MSSIEEFFVLSFLTIVVIHLLLLSDTTVAATTNVSRLTKDNNDDNEDPVKVFDRHVPSIGRDAKVCIYVAPVFGAMCCRLFSNCVGYRVDLAFCLVLSVTTFLSKEGGTFSSHLRSI